MYFTMLSHKSDSKCGVSWAAEAGKSLILTGFSKGILMVFAGRLFLGFSNNSGVG